MYEKFLRNITKIRKGFGKVFNKKLGRNLKKRNPGLEWNRSISILVQNQYWRVEWTEPEVPGSYRVRVNLWNFQRIKVFI